MHSTVPSRPSLRLLAILLSLFALGLAAGGYGYYRRDQHAIAARKHQELHAIAQLKVGQVLAWRQERLEDARKTSSSPLFARGVAAWLADRRLAGLQSDLQGRLVLEQQHSVYADALLLDCDGHILLSAREEPDPVGPATVQAVDSAFAAGAAVLGDFYRCPHGRVHLDAVAPVVDALGRSLAAVVLRSNAEDFLYPLIGSWPTPSRSAETLLVRRDGADVFYLNDLRQQPGAALSLRIPLTRTDLPAVQAVLGREGVFEGVDYRGVAVLADLSPVPGATWYMVAKVDRSEILAEAHYRAGVVAGFALVSILLALALTAYAYRQRQADLYRRLYEAGEERHQAQEEFRATLYSIGDGVITTDTEGRVCRMNPVAERLTGWAEGEAQGLPLSQVFRIVNEETRAQVENPVQKVLRDGAVVGLANHALLLARDGAEHPVADSGAPIRSQGREVSGVVLTFRDQTQDRAAAAQVEQQKDLLATLVNRLPDYIYVKDRDSRFVLANEALAADLGCAGPEELVGRSDQDFFPPAMAAGFLADEQEVLRTGRPLINREERVQTAPGRTRFVLSSKVPLRDRSGAVTGLVGIGRDITRRKQDEQRQLALHRVRDQVLRMQSRVHWIQVAEVLGRELRALITYEDCGINFIDRQQRRVEEGDWEKVTASVHAELRPLLDFAVCSICRADAAAGFTVFYRPRDGKGGYVERHPRTYPAIQQALETGQPVYRRTRAEMERMEDGVVDPTIQSVVDVPFSQGTLAVNSTREEAFAPRDIDVLRQFAQVLSEAHQRSADLKLLASKEAQLRQAQKMEAVGRLAGGVAHDFNNLLTVINGNCQLLLRRLPSEDPRRSGVEQVYHAGERAAALVRQLLAFSRRQAWRPEVLDPNRLITDLSRMLGRLIGEDIELDLKLAPEVAAVQADRGQLEQALMNLVVNARDAMPTGGRLTLETANVRPDRGQLASHGLEAEPGPYVLLAVSDTGTGMDAQTQARLFEPFFTTKAPGKGTGLGLATVYGIVQHCQGYIWVYSELGQGSTFRIYLPQVQPGAGPRARSEEAVDASRGCETILVVEDDAPVRGLVVEVLQGRGYTVLQAQNGTAALQVLRQTGSTVQLLLTDVVMPGMTGAELAERVRCSHPAVRILYMSGYAEHAALPQDLQGMPLIQKPFAPDELTRQVRLALDRREMIP
ncbi:MAG: PAS domain-containing protein [Candidatus Latescibacterota bacterium]